MRCLNRNKIEFYYALYDTREPVLDEYEHYTGQYTVKYHPPQRAYANISAAKGTTNAQLFGEVEQFDRVIVLDDPKTSIDEHTVLWVDSVPSMDTYGELVTDSRGQVVTPWNYVVCRVARSINSALIAINRVENGG